VLALQIKDLVVGARIDGDIVPAIRALSFDLPPGKILGLVGESGAGKSMVGRAIAQLLPAGFTITAGSLLFEGHRQSGVRCSAAPSPSSRRRR
jgi:ABC-type glutathione transport system ATPase component